MAKRERKVVCSLLLALLWHVFHHVALLSLGLLHFFGVDVLHELAHKQGHAHHDDKRVLQIAPGIEGWLDFVIANFAAWVELQRVNQSVVLALVAEQERLRVLAFLELFIVDLNKHWLKVVAWVVHLDFVEAGPWHLNVELAKLVDEAAVDALLHRDGRLGELEV